MGENVFSHILKEKLMRSLCYAEADLSHRRAQHCVYPLDKSPCPWEFTLKMNERSWAQWLMPVNLGPLGGRDQPEVRRLRPA